MFDFFKNKKDKATLEDSISESVNKNENVEKAIITYLLLQARNNNISLARKNNICYVHIKNDIINNFLDEWYTLLQLYQRQRLSDKTYEVFIKSYLDEKTSEAYIKADDDFEDI